MQRPKIKARYQVVGPKLVKRHIKKCRINPETKSMEHTDEVIEEKMWMIYFPQGHSVRMNEKELRYHNLHLRPRLVDMNTGDVIDAGGDPYDLDNISNPADVQLEHDADDENNLDALMIEQPRSKRSTEARE